MALTKRYKDGDVLHASVFNELLNIVENLKNTWRPIKVDNTEILNSNTNTKPLNLIPGEGVTMSHDNNGNVTINAAGGGEIHITIQQVLDVLNGVVI